MQSACGRESFAMNIAIGTVMTTSSSTKQIRLKSGVSLYTTPNPQLLHIGTARTYVSLPSMAARTLFKLLSAGASLSEIATASSIQESELEDQVNALLKSGLIEDEANSLQLSQRFVSTNTKKAKKASAHIGDAAFDQLRKRVAPELLQAKWVQGVRDNGAAKLSARQSAHIEISGQSRAATALFSLLLASGVTNTQFGMAYRRENPLIDDLDIEAGVFRSIDLGKSFKSRTDELSKELSLFPKVRDEIAGEIDDSLHEQSLKIHFGEIDPQILALWMSAKQQFLLISRVDGAFSTIGPIVQPGVTPCSRCWELTLAEQSGNIEVLEVIGSQIEELPVVASHQLAATVASIVLQLIDTHESEIKGSVLTIDHLRASNLRHIPISIHPACGCSW